MQLGLGPSAPQPRGEPMTTPTHALIAVAVGSLARKHEVFSRELRRLHADWLTGFVVEPVNGGQRRCDCLLSAAARRGRRRALLESPPPVTQQPCILRDPVMFHRVHHR
jgi:hypothetical protein